MKHLRYSLMLLGLFIASIPALSQTKKPMYHTTEQNVAIGGYDVVAYFTQNQATRGSQQFSTQYDKVDFYFSSLENQKLFKESPDKFLPQYGGWCAFAVGMQNAKVPSDPRTFKLYNGKLYLFFNDYYKGSPFNTIIPWNSDETNIKMKADQNWPKLN